MGQSKISVPADDFESGVKVKASWKFNGTYSGTSLPEVIAEGEISK